MAKKQISGHKFEMFGSTCVWMISLKASSWELPDLRDGKIPVISDSDGVNYPWYGNTTETCTVVGPTKKPSLLSVSMNDNFYPSVTWAVPVGPGAEPQLSGISRDQSFITWLVAREQFSGEMLVLRTLRWRMKLQISIDPNKPLGQRSTLGPPTAQEPPQLIQNQPVPISALIKPNANDAQVLMWRPSTGLARVVIPAKFSER
ncbi:hypothetical protein DNTS_005131 [Danionella cerebrum]|uniref:Protein FAM78A n=1 Tax=Danionella cerebrum TaxID=2873325 RepID=A0A553Q0X3_9TELE|nr:hypothetical protein DNTS_005131 [Danionella translucida]